MSGVFYRHGHRIIKYSGGMGKLDAMIPNVPCGLSSISNNFHTIICILYVFVN